MVRNVVPVEAREEYPSRFAPELAGIVIDDGHRDRHHLGQLEVVEADDGRQRRSAPADDASRVPICLSAPIELRLLAQKTAVGGSARSRSCFIARLAASTSCCPRRTELRVDVDPELGERLRVPLEPSTTGEHARHVSEVADPGVTGLEQRLGAPVGTADVVEHDGVGVQAGHRAGREDERRVPEHRRLQVGRVVGRRHEHEPFDLAADEVGDELALATEVFIGVAEHDPVAVAAGDLLHPEREVAVVRVAEVGDGDPDQSGRLSGTDAARILVAEVAE